MCNHSHSSPSDFVIACSRVEPGESDIDVIRQFAARITEEKDRPGQVDLNKVIAYANRHGVTALVCQAVKTHAEDMCDAAVLARLQSFHLDLAANNVKQLVALARIMDSLDQARIPAASFKGLTLAELAFADIGLRPAGDLDILVNEEDFERARAAIIDLNYKPAYEFSDYQREKLTHVVHAETFYDASRTTMVELHWRLSSSEFWAPVEKFDALADRQFLSLNRYTLPTLEAKKLLVYLCFHAQRHAWSRLLWLVDLDRMVRRYAKEDSFFSGIIDLAEATETSTIVITALALSHTMLDTPLSVQMNERIYEGRVKKLTDNLLDDLTDYLDDYDSSTPPRQREYSLTQARLLDGPHKKVKYFLSVLDIQESDYAIAQLPRGLHFLYYFLRPLNLISRKVFGARNG